MLVGQNGATPALADAERELLELIGQHPFLTMDELSQLCNGNTACCGTLKNRGLLRQVQFKVPDDGHTAGPDGKVPPAAASGLELTQAGLKELAAHYGLPPHAAVRQLGLVASGGPDKSLAAKRRRHAFRHSDHTRGVHRVFVRFFQDVRRKHAGGEAVALVQWWPGARCASSPVQPDAYGVYEVAGVRHGFFLEYDRGTERTRELRRKFDAYQVYQDSGAYQKRFRGLPAILVVTVDKRAEDRILRILKMLAPGQTPLPVLVTNEQRMASDPDGYLGCVWRGAEPTCSQRSCWPPSGRC